jgi:exodeoxyribonuclease VII small subunit
MTIQPVSFDEDLSRLEAIVQKLENGHLSLEEALTEFEAGVNLSKTLQQQLSEAQRRVEVLKQGLGGEYQVNPLEGEVS